MVGGWITAWTEGRKARSLATWLGKLHQKKRFHGIVHAKDLVGISTARIVWTKRRGEDEVRRDGSLLIVNVSSLDPADARDVVAQLRIEGLKVENEDQESST
jgi:hypothetical protein